MTAVAEDLNLDLSAYAHSPAHLAVARRDHAALHRLLSGLPRLAGAGELATEEESLAAEIAAEAVSAAIDRRDVPGREILAVAGAGGTIPGVRVLATFTKFEEPQPSDEFATPPSSPTHFQVCKAKETEGSAGSQGVQSCESSECQNSRDKADPFLIPSNYTWIDEDRTRRGLKAPEVKKQSSKSPSEGHPIEEWF